MVEAFMVEAEWVKRGTIPNLKDYTENGITTAGTYMALVHLLFLIGEGVANENMKNLLDQYPSFFSTAGKILRLWDDLGTFKVSIYIYNCYLTLLNRYRYEEHYDI